MDHKIYKILKNTTLYDFYSYREEKAIIIKAQNIPFITYPNFLPCFEANAYMYRLYRRNLSTLNNGGSLKTYAVMITHLIKYIYEKKPKLRFSDLDDNHMFDFINNLKKRKISNNRIISIFIKCIDFLFFISELYNKPYLIGVGNKFQIKLTLKRSTNYKKNYNKANSYTHLALPRPDYDIPILPISIENIKKIRNIVLLKKDSSIKFRNLCILDLLEFTGARRTEIMLLTTHNIKNSNRFDPNAVLPLLQFKTLKKRGVNNIRYVPIPHNLLNNLLKYIRQYRAPIIKKLGIQDHGLLFISHKSGKPLSTDTITTYLHDWSSQANINPPVHAHQFRHRYITEKFKAIIKQHDTNNPDLFNKLLISHERLKQEVLQWTGHTDINSLTPYIHLAINELTNIHETLASIAIDSSNKYYKEMIQKILVDFRIGKLTKDQCIAKIINISNE
jgi:site-specific recombinase XerD